jgi:hypothetical protein
LGHSCDGPVNGSAPVVFGLSTLVIKFILSNSYMRYYMSCVHGDLADIAGHYNLHPASSNMEQLQFGPCGFWIAEKEHQGGREPEIVGFVGLGMD